MVKNIEEDLYIVTSQKVPVFKNPSRGEISSILIGNPHAKGRVRALIDRGGRGDLYVFSPAKEVHALLKKCMRPSKQHWGKKTQSFRRARFFTSMCMPEKRRFHFPSIRLHCGAIRIVQRLTKNICGFGQKTCSQTSMYETPG